MTIQLGEAVHQVRSAFGLDPATVAKAADLDTQSLLRYESGEQELPGEVVWRLSDVLGVPLEDIDSSEVLGSHIDSIAVRFKADYGAISPGVRLAVARAAAAAGDYVQLEELAGREPRFSSLVKRFPTDSYLPAGKVWQAGRDLAMNVRSIMGIVGHVPSMRSLVDALGISMMWQKLPNDIAGYGLCDEIHGPTIVVNVNGRNVNELIRRFTLAHEICHVLFDRDYLKEMSAFDTYDELYSYADGQWDPREVRANAFAIHLLLPELALRESWGELRGDVRKLMTKFGVNYEAVRCHLDNYRLLHLSERISRIPTTASDEWKIAESGELWYPAFDVIPIERRHALACLAFRLWRERRITTSRLREVLAVRLSDVELRDLAELYEEPAAA